MLRIVMLVFNVAGKGTYWRALALGQGLVARGHSVTLLAISPATRWGFDVRAEKGVTVVETPDLLPGSLRSGWDLWDVVRRVGWLQSRTFDLVHAFECRPVTLLPALYMQRGRGLPLVMDWCDWFGRGGSVEERSNPVVRTALRPLETFFEESFRTHADGTTAINTVLRDKAVELGVQPDRILLLPNGANVQEIQPGDRSEARQRLGLPLDSPLIAYTGAIFQRDAYLMAEAFDEIHRIRPDSRLLLIGYCNIAVERLVRAPEAVIRTGPVSYQALADHLAASDLGWLPLRNSGANQGRFPLKVSDFLAAGRPIVATDVGDLGALLRREPIGRLAPDEPGPLAEAVLALLSDGQEREQLGRNARHVAETQLAWSLTAERLEEFYLRTASLRSDSTAIRNSK
jgi:glycosyltransferase involved in cell wall biosynthesis